MDDAGTPEPLLRGAPVLHIAGVVIAEEDTVEQFGCLGVGHCVQVGVGDPMAPWHGGAASLTTEFIKKYPDVAKKYMAAYKRGVDLVKTKPDEARPFLKGYTAIEGPLTAPVSCRSLRSPFRSANDGTAIFPVSIPCVVRVPW